MADAVSALLQILLMADGSNENTWGANTNVNLQKLEAAICGQVTIDLSAYGSGGATSMALSDDQARPYFLIFGGSPSGPVTVTVPDRTKRYIASNITNQNITLVTAGGASYSLAAGSANATVTRNADGSLSSGGVIGLLEDYAGVELPNSNYLWANGATVSRTGFANLLAAITKKTVASGTGGTPTLNCGAQDISGKGLAGAVIEGTGIPSGTTITNIVSGGTSSTLTLSNNLTGTVSNVQIQIFPYGNGDGSTTFTLPDAGQRIGVARGTMGGAADPGRLTSSSITAPKTANSLGAFGGVESVGLTANQNGPHNHTLTDPGHNHAITDPGHSHDNRAQAYIGADGNGKTFTRSTGANSGVQTSTETTGITINSNTTGISIASSGAGAAHTNVQPFYVCNKIIRVN